MKTILSLLALAFPFFCSCQQQKADFQSLPVENFSDLIANPEVQLLDVRTVAEYSEGHILGSININVLDEANFLPMAEEMLQKDKPVALYCRSGKRSKKAAEILSKKGFKVTELDSGINGWRSAGKEIKQ
ncbi:MAG: rhodanese-like domain-containing protein [Bacteroides sp.]|nr:rhodanese-like domain-containing protein [Bacteroides sp.]